MYFADSIKKLNETKKYKTTHCECSGHLLKKVNYPKYSDSYTKHINLYEVIQEIEKITKTYITLRCQEYGNIKSISIFSLVKYSLILDQIYDSLKNIKNKEKANEALYASLNIFYKIQLIDNINIYQIKKVYSLLKHIELKIIDKNKVKNIKLYEAISNLEYIINFYNQCLSKVKGIIIGLDRVLFSTSE